MYLRYTIIALLLFNRRCCCYSGHCLEFLEKRDNVVLGPFCKTTCTWSPYSTRGTLVFIERAYHDRNKSQWNLLLRVDRLSLDEPFRLWTTSEVFLSEESERTERNLEDGYLRSPVEHSFSLVWTGKKTIFAHSICFLLIEYCKQTNLIDCRWNCAFQFLFQNFDHLIPWVNPVDFCFNSSTRSSRSLLFSGEDYREN